MCKVYFVTYLMSLCRMYLHLGRACEGTLWSDGQPAERVGVKMEGSRKKEIQQLPNCQKLFEAAIKKGAITHIQAEHI